MNHPFLGIAKIVKTQNGSASRAYVYITRTERFANRISEVEYKIERNYPSCCHEDKNSFWKAGDGYERTNGTIALAIVATLPPRLDKEERSFCVDRFVESLIGERHAFSAVIHHNPSKAETSYPHLHLLFSPRANDGFERSLEQFFSRSNPRNPERGGALKETDWSKTKGIERIRNSFIRGLQVTYNKKQQVLEQEYLTLRSTLYDDLKGLYSAFTKTSADERVNESSSENNKIIELSRYHQPSTVQPTAQEIHSEMEKAQKRLRGLEAKRVSLGLKVPIQERPQYPKKISEMEAFELATAKIAGREWLSLRREYEKLDSEFRKLEMGLSQIRKRKQELGIFGFVLRRQQYLKVCEEEKHCYRRLTQVQTNLNDTASRLNVLHDWLCTKEQDVINLASRLQEENKKERSRIAKVEFETYRLHQRLATLSRHRQPTRNEVSQDKSKQREDFHMNASRPLIARNH
jgi:hypothetical protein